MARDCKPKFFKKRLRYLQEISTRDAQYLHYMVCCYGRYIKNIDLLSEKGITISEFGGCSLSHLISFKNDNFVREVKFNENKLIRKLIKGGADVNYNKYDTVLASTSTPLMNAVVIGDIGLVKYLIKYGADVTLTDQYGVRAKDIAIRQGNVKLIKLLNKYESPEYKAAREKEKNEFNIPEELVKFLKSDKNNRCIKFSNDSIVKNIEFYSYDDIVWFNYKKNKVIDLVSYVENFSTPMFVLNLKNNKVYGLDNEHDNFTLLADWNQFYKKMEYYVDGYIRGKFDK
jgi:ankyrin repeat protein